VSSNQKSFLLWLQAQLVFEYINLKIAVLVAFPNMTPAAEPHAADAVAKAAAAARSSSVDDFWWQVRAVHSERNADSFRAILTHLRCRIDTAP